MVEHKVTLSGFIFLSQQTKLDVCSVKFAFNTSLPPLPISEIKSPSSLPQKKILGQLHTFLFLDDRCLAFWLQPCFLPLSFKPTSPQPPFVAVQGEGSEGSE